MDWSSDSTGSTPSWADPEFGVAPQTYHRLMRRTVLLLLAVTMAACSGAPAPDAGGEEIYRQLCASCHAPDLSGNVGPALGPDSAASLLDDEVLAATISRGRGSRMPAFGQTLDDSQITRVVAYLREQQDR